jgi:nitric oxide reductase NorE protein
VTDLGLRSERTGAVPERRIPGEEGIWVFVLGDMCVFALFFVTFMYSRGRNPGTFAAAHTHLHVTLGLLNTILLLTSSLLVALAVQRAVAGAPVRNLVIAVGCGAAFIVVKVSEWALLLHSGLGIGSGEFFSYYFMFTGIHLGHVLIGLTLLVRMIFVARAGAADARAVRTLESGGVFWHMVDLLWVVLFALFYLVD